MRRKQIKVEEAEKLEGLNKDDNSPSSTTKNLSAKQGSSIEHSKDQDEISPSPIIGNPYPRQVPPFEERDHGDVCGCHDCFMNMCKQEKHHERKLDTINKQLYKE